MSHLNYMSSATQDDSYNGRRNSPRLMTADLGLDPSDPLNLLLHNSFQGGNGVGDSSMEDEIIREAPDWSQLSNIWDPSGDHGKMHSDFHLPPLNMDMEFNPSISIDPSLHFDQFNKIQFDYNPMPHEPNYAVSLQPKDFLLANDQMQHHRRMSDSTYSTPSAASISPIQDHRPVQPQLLPYQFSGDPVANELAQRVRQSAGVTLAVPVGTQLSDQAHLTLNTLLNYPSSHQTLHSPISVEPTTPQSFPSSSSSAASTPPPSTPPPATNVGNGTSSTSVVGTTPSSVGGGTVGMIGRPKTSHTTIERRYRTNLNARIQSLRMAVPALRVLENQTDIGSGGNSRKVKVKIPIGKIKFKRDGVNNDEDLYDVVDERGFVDGVKVARKCSKANVLGKAVEYITVLKKREMRLKHEQEGLKSLLCGLVGGAALLQEWEKEWKEKFGGEEKDEIEADEMAEDADGSDDDEGADDDDEDEGKKRKKIKLSEKPKKEAIKAKPSASSSQSKASAPTPTNGAVVPEKRKRGRPRKVVAVPPPASAFPVKMDQESGSQTDQSVSHQGSPQQYLLATFALFSFFNSPLTSYYTQSTGPRTHTGTVLSHNASVLTPDVVQSWGWKEVIQVFHLVVSVLIFASIVTPWGPMRKLRGKTEIDLKKDRKPAVSPTQAKIDALKAALSFKARGSQSEADNLRRVLNDRPWPYWGATPEIKQLEHRAWVRLSELSVLEVNEISIWARVKTFLSLRWHTSEANKIACDLATKALLIHPLDRVTEGPAKNIWSRAQDLAGESQIRAHERLVFDTLSVDDASRYLRKQDMIPKKQRTMYSPMGIIACELVAERIKRSLQLLFIRQVSVEERKYDVPPDQALEAELEADRKLTADAARSLGGKMAELGDLLEKIWTTGVSDLQDAFPSLVPSNGESEDESDESQKGLEGEIKVLLRALLLYRKVFPSSLRSIAHKRPLILLSPPPSPGSKDLKLKHALRRSLGGKVFESEPTTDLGAALEDARDRVVDLLVDSERGTVF